MSVRRVLLYGVLVVALCAFWYVQGEAAQAGAVAEQDAYHLLAGHTTAGRLQDSLTRLMRSAKADFDSLRAHPRYVTIITAHHDTIRAIDTVWVNQQVADLNHAYSACDLALTLCHARSDSLTKTLRDVLATRTCRILFLSCPSREVAFFGGAFVGAVLSRVR